MPLQDHPDSSANVSFRGSPTRGATAVRAKNSFCVISSTEKWQPCHGVTNKACTACLGFSLGLLHYNLVLFGHYFIV